MGRPDRGDGERTEHEHQGRIADLVARFCFRFPGEFRGGEIPWRRFWRLAGCLDHIEALDLSARFVAANYLAAAVWGRANICREIAQKMLRPLRVSPHRRWHMDDIEGAIQTLPLAEDQKTEAVNRLRAIANELDNG